MDRIEVEGEVADLQNNDYPKYSILGIVQNKEELQFQKVHGIKGHGPKRYTCLALVLCTLQILDVEADMCRHFVTFFINMSEDANTSIC